jgi:hypothetical protein
MPPSKNPDYIDWKKSEAKKVLMRHLESETLPLEDKPFSAEIVWMAIYKDQPEFENVCFKQFAAALKRHRGQISKKKAHLKGQMMALHNFRAKNNPLNLFDSNGNKRFRITEAYKCL